MIQQDTKTVNVTLNGGWLPVQNLGCQVEGRAGEIRRCIVVKLSASTEVHQHDATVFSSHDVVRLDVPMEQPGTVHGGYRTRELETDADCFDRTDLSVTEDVLEGIAANELHPESDLIGNLLGTVDGDDVRMPYPGQQSALVDDRGRCPIAGGAIGWQQLQRDFPIEPRVPRAVNLSEGSLADPLDELKVTP